MMTIPCGLAFAATADSTIGTLSLLSHHCGYRLSAKRHTVPASTIVAVQQTAPVRVCSARVPASTPAVTRISRPSQTGVAYRPIVAKCAPARQSLPRSTAAVGMASAVAIETARLLPNTAKTISAAAAASVTNAYGA